MTTPLAWFDLPRDASERELKQAYARRLKETRPDVDPQGFQLLRSRYEAALAWCRQQAESAVTVSAEAVVHDDFSHEESGPGEQRDVSGSPVTERPIARIHAWHSAAVPPGEKNADESFDVDAFVLAYLQVSATADASQLQAWLEGQQAMWSLRYKQTAGHAVVRRLFADPPPMAEESFDATLAFFHLDNTRSAFDPLHVSKLRELMQDRLATQRHAEAMVQDWGTDMDGFDVDAFYLWFCLTAIESSSGQLDILLQAQPALRSHAQRKLAAPVLLERLCLEHPAMPSETFDLLVRFFRLDEYAHVLAPWQTSMEELSLELEIKWLTMPRQIIKLSAHTYMPGKPYAEVLRTKRNLHWASKPFHPWWILCICLLPGLPRNLGFFFWRLSGGAPARLSRCFDPRMVQFFLRAGSREQLSGPRLFVGAIRCTLLLLLAVGCDLLLPEATRPQGGNAWGLTFLAVIATLGWAGFITVDSLTRWQARAEEPATPLPLLRLGFIPALALCGIVWILAQGAALGSECFTLALGWLACVRFRQRNPRRPSRQAGKSVFVACGAVLLILSIVPLAIVPALGAITIWAADAIGQGQKLRLRRQAASPEA